jgi:hypothetical protein
MVVFLESDERSEALILSIRTAPKKTGSGDNSHALKEWAGSLSTGIAR